MNWESLKNMLTEEKIMQLLSQYESLGPLPGIFMTFIEAFLPILPLFAIVVGNAAAYGLGLGFLYSWLGTSLGATSLFLLFRKLSNVPFMLRFVQRPKVSNGMKWIHNHGFGTIFLLSCFPFTPSSLVVIVAALSRMDKWVFLPAIISGKAVMVFMMAFVGYDIMSFVRQPWKFLVMLVVILILWLLGKKVENRMHRD
ncbi:TVP38/TMEM64 family protein [Paenibacillus sp. FJAT-26967]|uniref:TVP38/TMEM64 family protein n=1 Tax=Paenibacillus sp. FJAT-26967 TaxID=1729690 RepID=UPI00083926ED|nr:TVP38/TMEM64 family protein [Paenibacillus sp. FJAT-26967]